VYLLYRKQAKEKIHRQQDELNRIKTDLTYVSLELEEKKKLLDTFKEKDDNYNKIEKEIALLTSNYKELQHKSLENSPTFKELVRLAKQNKPRNDKPLITDIVYVPTYQNKTFCIVVYVCADLILTQKQSC